MSDITKGTIVIHHGPVSYGRGKVLELLEAGGIPLASVQFDGEARPRPVRVAHLSVERALPMAVRLPVNPRLRLVYSRDGAAA
ncbi:MAG: hypothetical protein FD144_2628 [Rhodospirillaceae bacterium]|nr:MAG: hypothetical protein FD144_2628 [Rhodospirillaceae bacterium]